MVSSPKPAPPPPAPPPPTLEDPGIEEARRKEVEAARKAKGRQSTVVTGGQGDQSEAPVQRKTLLGE